MTMQKKNPNGIRKIVLIETKAHSYVEMELGKATQMVGTNGRGKTAIINAFQILFIDDERRWSMSGHSVAATKDFYFPTAEFSKLIWECDSDSGPLVIIARRKAQASMQIEFMSYTGRFKKSDFVAKDGDVKKWNEVRKGLNNLTTFTDDRRAALMGISGKRKATTPIGLVPLRSEYAGRYDRFMKLFLRSLRLTDLSQADLQEMILDRASVTTKDREFRPRQELAGELAAIQDERNQIGRIIESASRFESAQSIYRRLIERSGQIAGSLAWIVMAARVATKKVEKTISAAEAEIATIASEREEVLTRLADARHDSKQASEACGRWQEQMDQHGRGGDHSYPPIEELEASVVELESRSRELSEKIGMASSIRPEAITAQLDAAIRSKAESEKNSEGSTFGYWIKNQLGDRADAIARSIFSGAVLRTSAKEIKGRTKLKELLQDAIDSIDDARGVFQLQDITFPLPAGFELDVVIESLDDQITRLRGQLESVEDMDPLIAERNAVGNQLNDARSQLQGAKAIDALIVAREQVEAQLAAAHARRAEVEAEIDRSEEEIEATVSRKDEAENHLTRCRAQARSLADATANTPHFTALPGSTESTADDEQDVPNVLRRCQEAATLIVEFESGQREFHRIREEFRSILPSIDGLMDHDWLTQAGEKIEDAQRRSTLLTQRLDALLAANAARYQSMHLALTKQLASAASALSEEIGRNRLISNIEAIACEIILAPEAAELSTFAGMANPDSLEAVRASWDREAVRINDYFTVQIRITTSSGEIRTVKEFDGKAGSNGQVIVFKALINLLLLSSILEPGRTELPYYVDEIGALDQANREMIVEVANVNGFRGLYAGPDPSNGMDRIYFFPSRGDRVAVDPEANAYVIKNNQQ